MTSIRSLAKRCFNVSRLPEASETLASPRLSGTAFGNFGEGYLRFSVANSIDNIEKALDRIGDWTQKNL
jgi:aspartate/methionine/tyrosine aminotransferase